MFHDRFSSFCELMRVENAPKTFILYLNEERFEKIYSLLQTWKSFATFLFCKNGKSKRQKRVFILFLKRETLEHADIRFARSQNNWKTCMSFVNMKYASKRFYDFQL